MIPRSQGAERLRRPSLKAAAPIILAGALAALCACQGSDPSKAEVPVLRVASQKGGGRAMLLASHVLDGAPYRVQWSEFPSAQALLEALDADAVDIGGVGDAPFLFAYANNPKLKAVQAGRVAGGGREVAVVVQASSPIHRVADLKGRRIVTGKGSIGHYLLLRLLERAHIRPDQVQIVFLSPGDAKAALANGAVDAWSTWIPYTALETLHGGGREIANGSGVLEGYLFQASADAALAARRPQIADFLHRLAQAERWSQTHTQDFADALEHNTGLPKDIALKMAEDYRPDPIPIDPKLITTEQQTLARYHDAGVIPFAPKVDGAFDASFNDALKP